MISMELKYMKKKILASQGQRLILAVLTEQYIIFSVKNFKNELRKSSKSCFSIEFTLEMHSSS